MIFAAPIIRERCRGSPIEIEFIFGLNQSLIQNQTDNDTNRESAATKAETKDLVIVILMIATDELVNIDRVALQAISKRAAEYRKRFEARGSNAIVVEGDLVGIGQIDRLKCAPNICSPHGRR